MLTLQQAYEVKASITEYLKATFTFKERDVNQAFIEFIEGMFKGPYISLKLPFIKAAENEEIPLEIKPNFAPFLHQLQAFKRLTTENGNNPKPTILTTGTGSGKTEAFLYPVLDYCYKNKETPGIKVIILYPMNALATDQANRLAKTIFNDEKLKGKITAGLFIGEGLDKKKAYPKEMGKENIIENRDEIITSPPAIILTNFKMLDLSLMQNKFHNMWTHNYKKPELLKFIVLDELHTYEGAQGSDVANLIRRLKLKLNMPNDYLCPVGTSATIGKGDESKILLADFAQKVFGEDFDEDSVIEEHRVSTKDFFKDSGERNFIPTEYLLSNNRLRTGEDFITYIKKQLAVWGIDPEISRLTLSLELKNYKIIKNLIEACSKQIRSTEELLVILGRNNSEFASLPKWNKKENFSPREEVINSILSLISYAKTGDEHRQFPFLYLQVQLWVRELSGFVRVVDKNPQFKWRENIETNASEKALPVYFCRECGASGWFGVKNENKDNFNNEINDVYHKFFNHHKNLYLINLDTRENQIIDEYEPSDIIKTNLNVNTLGLTKEASEKTIDVIAVRKLNGNYNLHICPQCNSRNTINIVGQRVSTLSSVTVSQLLASDLDSRPEKHRKLLAFSNGVQDAAHLAGFLEARNYRFTFRTALQKVINQLGKSVSLDLLQKEFIDYWSNNADEAGEDHLLAYFYKFFPTDHRSDVDIEKRYKKIPSEFFTEFNNRVKWEIAVEFGYNSIIGRTLEKTGASASFFDTALLDKLYSEFKPWLDENALGDITKEQFLNFLFVFLNRLRTRGGVDHIYLNKFRTGKSNYFLITQAVNKQHFLMRNFGKNTRLPKFITDVKNKYRVFDVTHIGTVTNWYHTYFKKAFQLTSYTADLANEFYQNLLELLASPAISLLNEKDAQGIRNFAINPDQLFINNKVRIFECAECGNRISTTEENAILIEDAKCSVYRCTGSYQETPLSSLDNYYQQVYNRGRAPRVYAADHTGLIDRKKREELENEFKNRSKFNSLNTFVATSTLEMGIDIGSLNSAINASVPPLPSNFLQRVGRAGRESGSAIITNFVSTDNHDLFFFSEPLEMMDGEINTPGCYLEAKEIIRRHFFAYCIDSWTKEDAGNNTIPARFRFIRLESLDVNSSDFFLTKLISFIKVHEKALFESFKNSFRGKVDEEIFDELKVSIKSNLFIDNIKRAFTDLKKEILTLKEKQLDINLQAKERNLSKTDPEYLELRREYRNLSSAILLIRNRIIIEHMTNTGLLPNYAFPETGVTLKASISKKREDDPSKYDVESLEVVRSARSAIKELSPENQFYTQGYKLKITGVNITSWNDEVLDYRFCSFCDHIQLDIPPTQDHCPKCGSKTWRAATNTHKLVKLKTVNSFSNENSAKLDDSSEKRELQISHTTKHVAFNPNTMQGSWVMKKIPFGIEYVKEVKIHELNEGLKETDFHVHNALIINGEEVPKRGYVVCRSCGKAIANLIKFEKNKKVKKEAKDFHFGYCRNKSRDYKDSSDDVFEEVFFFRSMNTEAIKILLPIQDFNTEAMIKLFKAGISFGLKKYYRGNPGHISISDYREYNQKTQKNDRYLVLYDNIPGGTGYLSKLFDVEQFNKILELAYINIRDCKCRLEGKDGCYHCIYTYSNQFEREDLSRKKAEELFEKIYKAQGKWDYAPGGLSKISNTGQIEESELEERFIANLKNYFTYHKRTDSDFRSLTEDGTTKYHLTIEKDKNNKLVFEIRPQVNLGPSDGVKYSTIADFMITCISAKINGALIENPFTEFKQIAIYLDGHQYHASEENNRFITDLEKRLSILDTGKYFVWVLTWTDLDLFKEDDDDNSQNEDDNISESLKYEVMNTVFRHPRVSGIDNGLKKSPNNLSRLIYLMVSFSDKYINDHFKIYNFLFQSNFPQNSVSKEDAQKYLSNPSLDYNSLAKNAGKGSYALIDRPQRDKLADFRILQKIDNLEVIGSVFLKSKEKSYEKDVWESFWRRFNIIQFFHDQISFRYYEDSTPTIDQKADLAEDIFDNFDPKYHSTVKELLSSNIEFNKDDYFYLKDDNGSIIAEAFLGLPDHKTVIDPLSDESGNLFQKHGFKVFKLQEFNIKNLS